ncbi:MAG: NADH-quinone oxidoreductase subunit NuoF [Acidobacteria bacterium]|uniref:NADH-quinone oxidoreductase subunit NuoF n=1 Tax=Candidatus Polarisedimenticola svalbardensis TaxID=2886004 RepID=A0A8J6Y117_9BACT|nr:NADH-quinone oxidoreductase subunit NuoF [Candidatus Polarisedimenticola svalbardensis]
MRIDSREQFETLREEIRAAEAGNGNRILVCCGTGCLANGARKVAEAFAEQVGKRNLDAQVKLMVKNTGCHGFCERGPLVVLQPSGVLYTRVRVSNVAQILEKTVENGEIIPRLLYKNPADDIAIEQYSEIPFYKNQTRVAMRNIGRIDPTAVHDAIGAGCYTGMTRALFDMTPEQVLDEIETSGLRGRGGAGFGTARKWRSCRKAEGDRKFVLCNGDEGDPGAFKDRSIMEGDPHSILEGMVIGAHAVGAHEGFIYVRDEYPLAVVNLTLALTQARYLGLLGENILGSGFDFDIRISRGGGAFVCGESSALMLSLAGKVGEPRAKYVHSTEKGLFDLPTVLNNVETWADVGAIAANGGDWFAGMGTNKSKGTKAFSLVGKVKNTGLIELPMGTTLRHIIYDIGGGVLDDRPFKAVQTGGPSGGCIPEQLLDLPVDYEKLTEAGSMMGSGGMIVMDDRTCMVDVARYFLKFLTEESCGKCTPCREGLKQMLAIFDRMVEGKGVPGDLPLIERLAAGMQVGSLCELGKSAPNPVISTLRYFRDEYVAHIEDHVCTAGVCKELTAYRINPENCDGCAACAKACPVDAIAGERHSLHIIDHDTCISCGACMGVCPTDSVETFPKNELMKEVV